MRYQRYWTIGKCPFLAARMTGVPPFCARHQVSPEVHCGMHRVGDVNISFGIGEELHGIEVSAISSEPQCRAPVLAKHVLQHCT